VLCLLVNYLFLLISRSFKNAKEILPLSLLRYKALQMIGTQRSGSNLLRLMLNQLPEMFAPHPPHILLTFYPLLPVYGNLENEFNFKALIEDVCTLVELNPVLWDDKKFDRAAIFSRCGKRRLLEIFIRMHEYKCAQKNKSVWCCKSLESVIFLDAFEKEDYKPFIIYLERDGRDVAASFKKIMVGEKHIYHLASKWKKEQELALNYIASLPDDRFMVIKYEDLIANPEKIMRQLCDKIGLAYRDEILNYYASDESHKTAESGKMWANVTKPILKNNAHKFEKELSRDEIAIFETVAGDVLERLGYQRVLQPPAHLHFSDEQLKAFVEENKQLKKLALAKADTGDLQKRKAQNEFIATLKAKVVSV